MTNRKYEKIDLLNLYSKHSHAEWNIFLSECLKNHDLQKLETVLYGIQAGMDHLAKQKLNTPKMIDWFIRLQNSLENTIRDVIKQKLPNPLDNPLNRKHWIHKRDEKRKRDIEIGKHIRKKSF